jgi:hypothetical protein
MIKPNPENLEAIQSNFIAERTKQLGQTIDARRPQEDAGKNKQEKFATFQAGRLLRLVNEVNNTTIPLSGEIKPRMDAVEAYFVHEAALDVVDSLPEVEAALVGFEEFVKKEIFSRLDPNKSMPLVYENLALALDKLHEKYEKMADLAPRIADKMATFIEEYNKKLGGSDDLATYRAAVTSRKVRLALIGTQAASYVGGAAVPALIQEHSFVEHEVADQLSVENDIDQQVGINWKLIETQLAIITATLGKFDHLGAIAQELGITVGSDQDSRDRTLSANNAERLMRADGDESRTERNKTRFDQTQPDRLVSDENVRKLMRADDEDILSQEIDSFEEVPVTFVSLTGEHIATQLRVSDLVAAGILSPGNDILGQAFARQPFEPELEQYGNWSLAIAVENAAAIGQTVEEQLAAAREFLSETATYHFLTQNVLIPNAGGHAEGNILIIKNGLEAYLPRWVVQQDALPLLQATGWTLTAEQLQPATLVYNSRTDLVHLVLDGQTLAMARAQDIYEAGEVEPALFVVAPTESAELSEAQSTVTMTPTSEPNTFEVTFTNARGEVITLTSKPIDGETRKYQLVRNERSLGQFEYDFSPEIIGNEIYSGEILLPNGTHMPITVKGNLESLPYNNLLVPHTAADFVDLQGIANEILIQSPNVINVLSAGASEVNSAARTAETTVNVGQVIQVDLSKGVEIVLVPFESDAGRRGIYNRTVGDTPDTAYSIDQNSEGKLVIYLVKDGYFMGPTGATASILPVYDALSIISSFQHINVNNGGLAGHEALSSVVVAGRRGGMPWDTMRTAEVQTYLLNMYKRISQ